ncbi:hypothetical protein N480_00345 [Pseudoalteromonas luteoviolacea S2607]|uniref:hypothetical protein n=1 Tax=Pseudoalteromonas luteoviolacea TaxID=43657 RepID=UPI0007B03836|nr:hypothetical protein [Pseudoalteromonas luteoviolacea]KZN39310.1 hypothetical protein N480_00345 [Pseudoalteromonas luteoviolacea S2607]
MAVIRESKPSTKTKFLFSLFLMVQFGAIIGVFSNQFISSEMVQTIAIFISFFLTAFLCILTLKSINTGRIYFGYLKIHQRLVIYFLLPILMFVELWISFAISFPKLANFLIGSNVYVEDVVVKKKMTRSGPCKFYLALESIKAYNFDYCITEEYYNTLSANPYDAIVVTTTSFLGIYVSDIKLIGEQ